MLKQRVITALVLLALLLPALWAPMAWPFMLFVLLAISAGAWEWARLNGWEGARAWGLGGLVLLGFGGLLHQQPVLPAALWTLALTLWCLGDRKSVV